MLKSLSSQPFQLLFLKELFNTGPASQLDSLVHLDCGNGPIKPHFNVYTYSGNEASKLVPSLDKVVDSSATTRSIREWIQECRCLGRPLNESPFQPTRLLDVEGTTDRDHVTLIETHGISVPDYACLSYCWGGLQPIVNSTTRKSPPEGWTISLHELPKTFRDAIHVLRRLGYRYVWIDSLCIIQDDLDDKEREINQMPHIYKGSSLTLCASTARSCDEGFIEPRLEHSEFQLPVSLSDNKTGTIYLDRILWFQPPIEEPLGTRAWALQERLLSPRVIEYGWRTVRWNCFCTEGYSGYQSLSADISGKSGFPNTLNYNLFGYLNPLGPRRIPQQSDELFECWVHIVTQYTRRVLTLADDRLAAIGGIAAEIQARTKIPYLAGLWNYERLPTQLLWKVKSPLQKLLSRPSISRAPSWSWPAVDGPVSFNHSEGLVSPCRVLDTDVSGGFGLSARGLITVEAPVREGLWWYDGWDSAKHEMTPEAIALTWRDIDLSIWPDCVGEIFEAVDDATAIKALDLDLTFLAIGVADWDHDIVRGLVLARENKKCHRRVGFFQVCSKGSSLVADWETKAVRIL